MTLQAGDVVFRDADGIMVCYIREMSRTNYRIKTPRDGWVGTVKKSGNEWLLLWRLRFVTGDIRESLRYVYHEDKFKRWGPRRYQNLDVALRYAEQACLLRQSLPKRIRPSWKKPDPAVVNEILADYDGYGRVCP